MGKESEKDICITESLCCTPETNKTCKSTILQYKIKIKKNNNGKEREENG